MPPDWFWIVSPLLIVLSWFAVNWITSKRELNNWRRTTLLQAVTTLLEESHRRHSLCVLDDWSTSADARRIAIAQMTASQNVFLICEARGPLAATAEIIKQHIISDHAIQILQSSIKNESWIDATDKLSQEQRDKYTLEAQMDAITLKRSHDNLIIEYQKEAGLISHRILKFRKPGTLKLPSFEP